MKDQRWTPLLACALIATNTPFVHASGFNLATHGFVSQGYIKTTNNNYLLMSKDGSFKFNEVALNVSAQVHDRLRIGLQLFSRDFGFEGNNDVGLDWAYGDYHWMDALGIRFGKIKLPLGFYNQGRDVDLLRTSILLPQGVYDEAMRDFSLAHEGASMYGNLSLGLTGRWEYEAFYGTIAIPDPNAGYWRWVFSDLSAAAVRMLPLGSSVSIQDRSVVGKFVYGGALQWHTPVPGLTLGAHHAIGRLCMAADMHVIVPVISNLAILDPRLEGVALQNEAMMHMDVDVRIEGFSTFSAEYVSDGLICAAEYHRHTYKTMVSLQPGEQIWKSEGYYGQVSYRFLHWFEAGVYYSEFYPDRTDKDGMRRSAEGDVHFRAWQKDAAVTVRFDPIKNWCIKLETHFMNGAAQVYEYDNPKGFHQYWSLFAVKTSFGF